MSDDEVVFAEGIEPQTGGRNHGVAEHLPARARVRAVKNPGASEEEVGKRTRQGPGGRGHDGAKMKYLDRANHDAEVDGRGNQGTSAVANPL